MVVSKYCILSSGTGALLCLVFRISTTDDNSRYPIYEATWENADTLPDPDNLVEAFKQACMREELPLDTPEPILLGEAREWKTVLALTDPPGVKVPLVPSVPVAVA